MKKTIAKLLVACLVISIIPFSAFAEYTIPEYAVKLNASGDRIYEGETVDISFNINSEDFLMTDMSVGYAAKYFTGGNDTAQVVEFAEPEIKGAGTSDGEGGYNLATKFTFTANEVEDTVSVDFSIAAADIVYSYEAARDDKPTNVENRTGTSVVIVKQYDVSFVDEDGTTLIGEIQKIDKGLDEEADTALVVPAINYGDYVKEGLVADYYEHVWKYDGKEYTDEEIAAFGQTADASAIIKDTEFVLEVRPQTFNVTVPEEGFVAEETPAEATYGTPYTGKIANYDDKYDYKVKYEIGGNEQTVDCVGDSFTIPGENIIGDMTLSYEKELNITIKVYPEYVTSGFLVTVDGAAAGYTFEGSDMFISENHGNSRAWVYMPGTPMTEAEALAAVENLIFTSETDSPTAKAGFDINKNGTPADINDVALVHGAYTVAMQPVKDWVEQYLSADVNQGEGTYYKVNTLDYNTIVEEYKK